MSTIRANPDDLDSVARELERIAENIENGRVALGRAKEETMQAWQSRHTARFCDSVERTRSRVDNCAQRVRAIAARLRSTATNIRETERRVVALKRRGQ